MTTAIELGSKWVHNGLGRHSWRGHVFTVTGYIHSPISDTMIVSANCDDGVTSMSNFHESAFRAAVVSLPSSPTVGMRVVEANYGHRLDGGSGYDVDAVEHGKTFGVHGSQGRTTLEWWRFGDTVIPDPEWLLSQSNPARKPSPRDRLKVGAKVRSDRRGGTATVTFVGRLGDCDLFGSREHTRANSQGFVVDNGYYFLLEELDVGDVVIVEEAETTPGVLPLGGGIVGKSGDALGPDCKWIKPTGTPSILGLDQWSRGVLGSGEDVVEADANQLIARLRADNEALAKRAAMYERLYGDVCNECRVADETVGQLTRRLERAERGRR